jgi:glycosyltransferase involved in cell wall biosynthesis
MSCEPTTENIDLGNLAVLIPAWQPDRQLIELATALSRTGFGLILVVNDGSDGEAGDVFDEFDHSEICVVHHAINLGKGRALKTGFNILLTCYPHIRGVITADADGQHTVQDILKVARALAVSIARSAEGVAARPVLGSRDFNTRVPLRSRSGNTLTRYIFALVTGTRLMDTQTGLRGVPITLLPQLMTLEGERYEYEMTMLAHLCRNPRLRPIEVPIETVYFEDNRSSHFSPIRDSMRIYFVLARFYASSIIAAGVDFLGFALAFAATGNLLIAIAFGRLSSLLNFALNKRFVFHNYGRLAPALWRYYALAVGIAALSYGLIWLLTFHAHINVFVAKLCVDIPLSLVSFSVQRTFIFRTSEPGSI